MEKKYETHIRMSNDEVKVIKEKANKCNMSISKFMIMSSIDSKIILPVDIKETSYQLRKIGNNINQLTRLANSGAIECVDLKEVKKELQKIWQLLNSLITK